MPQQTEPGHIRHRMHLFDRRQRMADRIQARGGLDQRGVDRSREWVAEFAALQGRTDDAYAEPLAQDQYIARLGARITQHAIRVHEPNRNQSVDRLGRIDRVTAGDWNASLAANCGTTSKNGAHNRWRNFA